jgi:diadenosine tetraphosphate (Ap4A) HIT family hydrolase
MSEINPDRCPFCAMPAERVLEANASAFAVLDAYPASPGHSLVICRRHVEDIFDLTATEVGDLLVLVRSTRTRIDRTLRPAGYNLGVNVGKAAGQTVMHVHVHVIPRYHGDTDDPAGGVRGVIPGKGRYQPMDAPPFGQRDE